MLKIILFTLLIAFTGQNWAGKIYKWVDENGQIHYSSKKPDNQDVETVKVKKGPKVAPKQTKDSDVTDQSSTTDSDDDVEARAAAKKQLAAADAVNNKKQCELARKNYAALNASVRVVRTNEKGETVRMSDDERLNSLLTAQKSIDQYCN